MLNRIKKRHIALLSLLAAVALLAIVYIQNDQSKETAHIRPYDQQQDFEPLVKVMNENKFWVTENQDFSPEQMLLHPSPRYAPNKKATIDVVEDDETTAGFIAYYKKNAEEGYIWMLGVDKAFRGRGLGEKLVRHALANLKRQGARFVTLGTRLINKPALSLYKKLGFVEEDRDEERGTITLVKRNL